MYELHDTFTTKTQADVFVRVYNMTIVGQSGRLAMSVSAAPGTYQVWLTV